jgi:hypothetical protein
VTLTGTGFIGATAVRFGATPATSFTVTSASQITAVAPAGTGTVQVTVTSPGGTSSQAVMFTYVAASVPTLTSVTPSQGPATGGNTVTLTGTNLSAVTQVLFGGTPATLFTLVSATQITAVAPPGTGTVQITATSPGGTSNPLTYAYVPAPVLTSVAPNQGPTTGGTTLTLTGTGFTGATAVRFGATPATSFTVTSATQITAVAPPGAEGPVAVTVSTPGGTTSPSVPQSYFYYLGLPALSSVVPASGPTPGGNTVTLTGTNLTGATAVQFGATAASSFTVVSATQITAVAPAGTGTVQITVTTPGGTSNPLTYTYVTVPVLTAIAPNQGPMTGGATVTLTGTGLTLATAVTFGATPAPFTVISDTLLTAVVPAGAAGTVTATVTTPGGTSNGLPYVRIPPPSI